jgi:hypothetical protein
MYVSRDLLLQQLEDNEVFGDQAAEALDESFDVALKLARACAKRLPRLGLLSRRGKRWGAMLGACRFMERRVGQGECSFQDAVLAVEMLRGCHESFHRAVDELELRLDEGRVHPVRITEEPGGAFLAAYARRISTLF